MIDDTKTLETTHASVGHPKGKKHFAAGGTVHT